MPPPSGHGLHVLVVDDDPEFVRLLTLRLQPRGHVVDWRTSAFGIVNAVAGRGGAARPDVVVLDLMLPGLSGAAALELLARDVRARETPVVVVSAAPELLECLPAHGHARAKTCAKDGRFARLVEAIEGTLPARSIHAFV